MRGITFKPEMIQAIIERRKTVTRRLSGLNEINQDPDAYKYVGVNVLGEQCFELFLKDGTSTIKYLKPRYEIGETVYIKEAWRAKPLYGNYRTEYKLDNAVKPLYVTEKHDCWLYEPTIGYRTPLFMPEWAARYFPKILSVRAERLQEISGDDIQAEGCRMEVSHEVGGFDYMSPLNVFRSLWNSINPKYPWESNPWVWRYEFEL